MESISNYVVNQIETSRIRKFAIYSLGIGGVGACLTFFVIGFLFILSAYNYPLGIPGLNTLSSYMPNWSEGVIGLIIDILSLAGFTFIGVIATQIWNQLSERRQVIEGSSTSQGHVG